jgi:hypothetical protein
MKFSISLGLLSTVKFLFAPFGGPALKLSYFETYTSCIIGAIISASIFYFFAEYFLKRSSENKIKKELELKSKGLDIKKKKIFTRLNKSLIKIKHKFGIIGISFFAPLFFSIPAGTIVVAKFYGKKKSTYPFIVLGILINGLITTGISYLIANSVQ